MSDLRVYVAFRASDRLCQRIDTFLEAVANRPDVRHVTELDGITDPFLEEVLHTWFLGPVRAADASGPAVRIILGAMKVINKAAGSLAGRLMRKTTVAEQRALADHFRNLCLQAEGGVDIGYPLSPVLAERADSVFREFKAGKGNMAQLVEVMRGLSDGAIEYYLDRTLGNLHLGRLNRGLVAGARSTIHTAATASLEKGLPAMEAGHRKPVVTYFDNLLRTF